MSPSNREHLRILLSEPKTTALADVRFAPESRPIFHAAPDGCTEAELTHWTGQELATTYVIPMLAGEGGHAHSPVTFKQWITDRR